MLSVSLRALLEKDRVQSDEIAANNRRLHWCQAAAVKQIALDLILWRLRHVHGDHLPVLAMLLEHGGHANVFGFLRDLHFNVAH